MFRSVRVVVFCLAFACAASPGLAHGIATKTPRAKPEPPQDTGFLNRKIDLHGITYRFQVYLPEEWRRDDGKQWPIILFLHGRGERGSEGMWQTQFGIAEAVRSHPERWPFVIVMPQCPENAHWTDPAMLDLAMASLDQEAAEFHGDAARTYLSALSMGGYGAWELARLHPHRWAAIEIAASGVFWSYAPERWQESSVLPAEYAAALGRTPIWLFHGTLDTVVVPRQSELMFDAFKAAGGDIRLWLYQGLKHDSWSRAYDEQELPRWLLAHRNPPSPPGNAFAERIVVPLEPSIVRLNTAQLDSLTGEYHEPNGREIVTILRQGDQLAQKVPGGQITVLQAEAPDTFLRPPDQTNPSNATNTHLIFERDAQGRVTGYLLRDTRHEEHWVKVPPTPVK